MQNDYPLSEWKHVGEAVLHALELPIIRHKVSGASWLPCPDLLSLLALQLIHTSRFYIKQSNIPSKTASA